METTTFRTTSLTAWVWLAFSAPLAVAEDAEPVTGDLHGRIHTEYPAWFKDSFLEFADDVEEAAAEDRRVVIFFHQDGCPYCNALVERNLSQKHIEEKMRRNFDVIALNLRGDREVVSIEGKSYTEKSFASALNVQFTPTLLFLDESGKVALRLNGYVPPEQFDIALDYASQKAEIDLSYRDYLASRLEPANSGAMHEQSFFQARPHDLSAAASAGRPVAVFFEQRQCPNCDALHREILADTETISLMEGLHAVQLDMWADEPVVTPDGESASARAWASQLDVRYAPTIVLFSPDGREIIRSEAYLKRFHTQSLLDFVASGAYRNEPDFQRFLTDRANALRAQGRDVDIWK